MKKPGLVLVNYKELYAFFCLLYTSNITVRKYGKVRGYKPQRNL